MWAKIFSEKLSDSLFRQTGLSGARDGTGAPLRPASLRSTGLRSTPAHLEVLRIGNRGTSSFGNIPE